MRADAAGLAGEDVRVHQRVVVNGCAEEILQPAGKMKLVLRRDIFDAFQQFGIAAPTNFDASEQVGL